MSSVSAQCCGRVSRHERQVLIDRTREDDADRVRVPRVRRRARVRGAVFGLERPERAERLVVRYGRRREVVDDSRRGSVDDVRGGRGARLGPRADVQIPEEPTGGGGEAWRGVAVKHRARRVVEDSSPSKPAPRRGRIAAPPRRRPRRRRWDRRHRYERAHVCRSCGWSVDAAARARALNAGGKEGRFSSSCPRGWIEIHVPPKLALRWHTRPRPCRLTRRAVTCSRRARSRTALRSYTPDLQHASSRIVVDLSRSGRTVNRVR